MLTHVVIFWFKPEVNPSKVTEFRSAVVSELSKIPGVLHLNHGQPIPSERAVVDKSYSVAISMMFGSRAELDAYQVNPIHVEFIKNHVTPNVQKVLVYDFE